MIAICVGVCGVNEREKLQMRESLHSMQDLTDDEESPRFGMANLDVRNECRQAVQVLWKMLEWKFLTWEKGIKEKQKNQKVKQINSDDFATTWGRWMKCPSQI